MRLAGLRHDSMGACGLRVGDGQRGLGTGTGKVKVARAYILDGGLGFGLFEQGAWS